MEKFIFKNIIIPVFLRLKNQNRLNYYKKITQNNSLSIDELKEIQWHKLKSLINHCYKNIPYYKNLFDENGIHPDDIVDLESYKNIPLLKKQNIRDNSEELIDPRISKKDLCCSSTGGSTGIPVKIYKSREDREYGFAVRYRSNKWCGWEYGDKSAWIVSDTRRLMDSNTFKGKLGSWINRKLILNTKNTNIENMFKWAEQIKKYKPEQVYGYATILGKFARFLIDNNIYLDGIKGVFSTAEILRDRETISKAFNAPVYDQYGASEIPCIAHECPEGNMHINIDEVLVEYIDIKENNEIKKIICTPLYLYGVPLLRYEIGDCVMSTPKKCSCGLNYPVLEIKVSRMSDNLISPHGIIAPSLDFGVHIANMTEGVKQFQLIQENLTDFTFKIVCEEKVRQQNEKIIKEILHKILATKDGDINIKFEYQNYIPNCESGKFRPVISKVIDSQNKINSETVIN